MTVHHAPLLIWLIRHVLFLAVILGIAVVGVLLMAQVGFLVPLLLAACLDGIGRCFGRRWHLARAVWTFFTLFLVSIPSIRTGHWITRRRDGHLVNERYFRLNLPWPHVAMRDPGDHQAYACGRQISWSRSVGVRLEYARMDATCN